MARKTVWFYQSLTQDSAWETEGRVDAGVSFGTYVALGMHSSIENTGPR